MRFQSFILRYQFEDKESFADTFMTGCLLTSANPTNTSQRAALVYPVGKKKQPKSAGIKIGASGGTATTNLAKLNRITLGREADRDIHLPFRTVSKQHAYFSVLRGILYLTDNGSANGTIVNGLRLAPKQRLEVPEGIVEIWFGDEQLFLFDTSTLYGYLQHLSNLTKKLPAMEAEEKTAPQEIRPPTISPLQQLGPGHELALPVVPGATAKIDPATARRPEPSFPGAAPEPRPINLEETHESLLPTASRHELEQLANRWEEGVKTLTQLFPEAREVRARLSTQSDPVVLFKDGSQDTCDKVVGVLNALSMLVTHLEVEMRGVEQTITVFER